tara:strand:+ start:4320 stop:4739 length:420 start_codon:yes stop_codon:yes gene_type:complete
MLSKKVKGRIKFLLFLFVSFGFLIFFTLKILNKNVVYFFTPTEIYKDENIQFSKKIRIGGIVKKNSVKKSENSIKFIITDLKNEVIVSYSGLIPNLFSEGKGVVAEGKLKDKKFFIAKKILAKHDENYMPPEISDILKE